MVKPTGEEDTRIGGKKDGGIGSNKSIVVGLGRYPANVILDEDTAPMVDEQSGNRPGGCYPEGGRGPSQFGAFQPDADAPSRQMNDSGGASRFFYTAKASPGERNGGCETRNNHPLRQAHQAL
jgi:site-specific DNA-methyltransferase (adenine-specific)